MPAGTMWPGRFPTIYYRSGDQYAEWEVDYMVSRMESLIGSVLGQEVDLPIGEIAIVPDASLSPNPAHPGSALTIQVAGFENPDMHWNLRDAYGRSMAEGKTLLTAQENFSIDAPASSGIYFVEIRSGVQFIWLKFTVVH